MYQYFPHKQALIYAVNERYLGALANKIEITCRLASGTTFDEMIEALIDIYWRAKTERADVTRALYLLGHHNRRFRRPPCLTSFRLAGGACAAPVTPKR